MGVGWLTFGFRCTEPFVSGCSHINSLDSHILPEEAAKHHKEDVKAPKVSNLLTRDRLSLAKARTTPKG